MSGELSERAVILAPSGRDSLVATDMLAEAGIRTRVVSSVAELLDALKAGVGCAIVTEEALAGADLRALSEWIHGQPQWSDFPIVLLTSRGGGLERNPLASRHRELLGNVSFLERPFHPTTFVSLVHSALRGRLRQYEARGQLDELNLLAADLEQRVADRTAKHEAAVAQLHEAQKIETLGQLTGGVAHDFNNLLTPITGALDLLNRKYGSSDERTHRLLSNALQAADRAKTLLQRLLGFARRQTLQTEAVNVSTLLGGMRDLIASSVGASINLQLRLGNDLPAALADANQLELAILNLCVNARDAMPNGGSLTVLVEEVAIGPMSSPRLKPGLYLRLSVLDSGVGMDSETLARAVEPFYSTKEFGRGTGLGLSMVHGLAAQLGGGFLLTSAPGEGTRADLHLPVAAEQAPVERQGHSEHPQSVGRSLRVLLIDDEDLVRTATAEMMRDLGHEVLEARGGTEALALFDERLHIDAVVTDYIMPGLKGDEVASRVAALRPDLPVLVITGYMMGASEDVAHLPRLPKPFSQRELAAALVELFDGDNVVSLRSRTSTDR